MALDKFCEISHFRRAWAYNCITPFENNNIYFYLTLCWCFNWLLRCKPQRNMHNPHVVVDDESLIWFNPLQKWYNRVYNVQFNLADIDPNHRLKIRFFLTMHTMLSNRNDTCFIVCLAMWKFWFLTTPAINMTVNEIDIERANIIFHMPTWQLSVPMMHYMIDCYVISRTLKGVEKFRACVWRFLFSSFGGFIDHVRNKILYLLSWRFVYLFIRVLFI